MDPRELDNEIVIIEDSVVIAVRYEEGLLIRLRVTELGDTIACSGKRGTLLRIDVKVTTKANCRLISG